MFLKEKNYSNNFAMFKFVLAGPQYKKRNRKVMVINDVFFLG